MFASLIKEEERGGREGEGRLASHTIFRPWYVYNTVSGRLKLQTQDNSYYNKIIVAVVKCKAKTNSLACENIKTKQHIYRCTAYRVL